MYMDTLLPVLCSESCPCSFSPEFGGSSVFSSESPCVEFCFCICSSSAVFWLDLVQTSSSIFLQKIGSSLLIPLNFPRVFNYYLNDNMHVWLQILIWYGNVAKNLGEKPYLPGQFFLHKGKRWGAPEQYPEHAVQARLFWSQNSPTPELLQSSVVLHGLGPWTKARNSSRKVHLQMKK